MLPTITNALYEDLPYILELQKECYLENAKRYDNDRILPVIQTQQEIEAEFKNSQFLKAVNNNKIIGSIRAYQNNMTCFIVRLFVHPDYQNRGIAKQLVDAIEQRFPHVFRYELFTGYKDNKNMYLYQSLGYEKFREDKRDDGMVFYFLEKIQELN